MPFYFGQNPWNSTSSSKEKRKTTSPVGLRHYPLVKGVPAGSTQTAPPNKALSAPSNLDRMPQPRQEMQQSQPLTSQEMPQSKPLTSQEMPQSKPLTRQDRLPPQLSMSTTQPLRPIESGDQLSRLNKNLPDGVRYEPLDNNTIQLLRAKGKLPPSFGQRIDSPQKLPTSPPASVQAQMPTSPPASVQAQMPTSPPASVQAQMPTSPPASVQAQMPTSPPASVQPQMPTSPPASVQPQDNVPLPVPMRQSETPFVPNPPVVLAPPKIPNPPDKAPLSGNTEAETQHAFSSPTHNPLHAATLERLIQDERNAHVYYGHLSERASRSDFQAVLRSISEQSVFWQQQYNTLLQTLYNRSFEPVNTAVNTSVDFDDGIELAVLEENKSLRALANLLDGLDDKQAAFDIQRIINKKVVNQNTLILMRSNTKNTLTL